MFALFAWMLAGSNFTSGRRRYVHDLFYGGAVLLACDSIKVRACFPSALLQSGAYQEMDWA